MLHVSILDGYVDEPTCLGVPPYISPYPRYIAGAALCYDSHARISYATIDQVRSNRAWLQTFAQSDVLVVIAGLSVPGRYLSGFPVSPYELVSLLESVSEPVKLLCGPAARHGFGMSGGRLVKEKSFVKDVFDLIIPGDAEIVLTELLQQNLKYDDIDVNCCRSDPQQIKEFAVKGAAVIQQHPFFPQYLISELETYRGCCRSIVGGCSFCSEPRKGPPSFRAITDICNEVSALFKSGIQHVRVGNQPCLFSYMAKDAEKCEFPRPNPEAVEMLFKAIRRAAPGLKTLHIDNANPGVLARYPNECRRIAKSIIRYHTSGDVAALGVESVDPQVIKSNNLKASAEEVLDAVRLLNSVGSKRGANGLPELLPGLNFLSGLKAETKQTFRLNYEFLKSILDEGLLLRRINLRQVIPIPGTSIEEIGEKNIHRHKAEFQQFKRRVRETIERPLLQRLVPLGTVLTNVYTEVYEGKVTFARQLGSYPLLIGLPGVLPLHQFYDAKVVDYGYRSITAVPFPLPINTASRETLEAIPGIGKKRAMRIVRRRPFKNKKELIDALDDQTIALTIEPYVSLD